MGKQTLGPEAESRLGGGVVRERSVNARVRPGLGAVAWLRGGVEGGLPSVLGAGSRSLTAFSARSVPQRTQDPTYFRDIPRAQDTWARIRAGAAHAPRDLLLRDHARIPLARSLLSNGAGGAGRRDGGRGCAGVGAGKPGQRGAGPRSGRGPPLRAETEPPALFGKCYAGCRRRRRRDGRNPDSQPGRVAGQARGSDAGQLCLLVALVALASASVTVPVW